MAARHKQMVLCVSMVECTYMYCLWSDSHCCIESFSFEAYMWSTFGGRHRAVLIFSPCVGMFWKIIITSCEGQEKMEALLGDCLPFFSPREFWEEEEAYFVLFCPPLYGQMWIMKLTGICIVFVQCLWNSAVTDHVPSRPGTNHCRRQCVTEELWTQRCVLHWTHTHTNGHTNTQQTYRRQTKTMHHWR